MNRLGWGATERGQSSTVGTVLLVAVMLVLATTTGVFVLQSATDSAVSETPRVALETTVTGSNITLTHRSGNSVERSAVEVVLTAGGSTQRVPLSEFTPRDGDGDDVWTAGETLTYPHGVPTGRLDVQIVHVESNAILRSGLYRIRDAGVAKIATFDPATVKSFESNQDEDGTFAVEDGGRTLSLANNTWKRVGFDYTVTQNTTLVFEFRSTEEGEIHGIGLETDNRQSSDRVFRLFGTQGWGVDDYDTYRLGDGWVRYEIPVGDYYTGDVDSLVLVNDQDDGTADATSWFRDVYVYENTTTG